VLCTGETSVKYFSEHRGHDCELAHLRLTSAQRQTTAGMMAVGMSVTDVLDHMQLSGGNENITCLHHATRQDMQNIKRDFNISRGGVLHKSDADSVAAWVARQQEGGQNIVRFIKFQGEEAVRGLMSDDFMLVLMADVQIVGLRQFAGPMKEVALDSTHGTNEYNFQLTTLIVIDDHGEGYPAAFCYSNTVTESSMCAFLSVCREAAGTDLSDVILMTDDTELYANAWTRVMGRPAKRLLCTWHVDRAWRRNLSRVKGDRSTQAAVYKTLRSLMELTDQEFFNLKLQQFVCSLNEDDKTRDFGFYFEREYARRPELWACSYRLGLRVHNNMHLEAMHRVLKHVHMQGRKVRCMDKSIHALMQFMRSKMTDAMPSVTVEEIVKQTLDPVPLDETTAILAGPKKRQTQCSLDTLDQHWADIRATVVQNLDLVSDACEQLLRVKAVLSAARTKPAVPRLPLATTSKEPANKKMTQQRHFLLTRKQHKRKPESSLSKPGAAEKALPLQMLDGNVEVVSRVAETADHAYNAGAGDTVIFEHCYAGGRQS